MTTLEIVLTCVTLVLLGILLVLYRFFSQAIKGLFKSMTN